MSATRPVRSAASALSVESSSTPSPLSLFNASTIAAARGPLFVTATCTISAGLLRNAIPSPIASRIGNPNDQKSASGSRVYSLKRTVMSCHSEFASRPLAVFSETFSLIAQLSPGERHEHVLERRGMCGQLRELDLALREKRQQCGECAMELADLEL